MFLAHLPAGYLLARGLLALPGASSLPLTQQRRLLITGLIASVLPDFDYLYFELATNHSISHRAFPSHWPPSWLLIFFLVAVLACVLRQREWHGCNLFLLAGVQLHFMLDTIAGPIRWLAPFDHTRFTLFHVPRQPGWWVWSYANHFSGWLEVAIIATALWLAWHTCRQHRHPVFVSNRVHSKE